jgi:hypothetical protein
MGFNSFTAGKAGEALPAPREFEVQTTTLDSFRRTLSRAIALLKIDAESAEEAILSGATDLLAQDRPIISIEVGDTDGQSSSRRPAELLCAAGYHAWEFSNGRFLPHALRQSYTYDNLIFAPQERRLA